VIADEAFIGMECSPDGASLLVARPAPNLGVLELARPC
jgi:hypothetical protein